MVIGPPANAWLCQEKSLAGGWPAIFYANGESFFNINSQLVAFVYSSVLLHYCTLLRLVSIYAMLRQTKHICKVFESIYAMLMLYAIKSGYAKCNMQSIPICKRLHIA